MEEESNKRRRLNESGASNLASNRFQLDDEDDESAYGEDEISMPDQIPTNN
jgi:hypothetical protein